jgi:hypothetical protein
LFQLPAQLHFLVGFRYDFFASFRKDIPKFRQLKIGKKNLVGKQVAPRWAPRSICVYVYNLSRGCLGTLEIFDPTFKAAASL